MRRFIIVLAVIAPVWAVATGLLIAAIATLTQRL